MSREGAVARVDVIESFSGWERVLLKFLLQAELPDPEDVCTPAAR